MLFVLFILLSACGQNGQPQINPDGYDLGKSADPVSLPPVLHEVSGISLIDAGTIACVQDERGSIFLYDLKSNDITREVPFGPPGDYEDIAVVGDIAYVLRSDGVIFEVSDFKKSKPVVKIFVTNIPASDNEGLCYDAKGKRLLVASKSKLGKGKEFKDIRGIFEYDLATRELIEQPAYEFDVQLVKDYAVAENLDIPSIEKKKKSGPDIKLRPSAISIHPVTEELYLLSAEDHLLIIYSRKGDLRQVIPLDPGMFNQAEGIAFLKNGDMLISNEGDKGMPTLLKFEFK